MHLGYFLAMGKQNCTTMNINWFGDVCIWEKQNCIIMNIIWFDLYMPTFFVICYYLYKSLSFELISHNMMDINVAKAYN